MLEVAGLTTRYGAISALRRVSLNVGANEVVGLIGPNGAGKTTMLNSVAGLLRPAEGEVRLNGQSVTGDSPDRMLRAGLALVPERRRLFAQMTVVENLRIGGVTVGADERAERLEEMVELFPVLRGPRSSHQHDRRRSRAGALRYRCPAVRQRGGRVHRHGRRLGASGQAGAARPRRPPLPVRGGREHRLMAPLGLLPAGEDR